MGSSILSPIYKLGKESVLAVTLPAWSPTSVHNSTASNPHPTPTSPFIPQKQLARPPPESFPRRSWRTEAGVGQTWSRLRHRCCFQNMSYTAAGGCVSAGFGEACRTDAYCRVRKKEPPPWFRVCCREASRGLVDVLSPIGAFHPNFVAHVSGGSWITVGL